MSTDSGRSEPQNSRMGGSGRHKDGSTSNRGHAGNTLRKPNQQHSTDPTPTSRQTDPSRSHTSTTTTEAGNRRHTEPQAQRSDGKDVQVDSEPKPSKRPKESHTPDETETQGTAADPKSSSTTTATSASRKARDPPTVEVTRRGSTRSSAQVAASLPAGAAAPAQPQQGHHHARKEVEQQQQQQQPPAAAGVTTQGGEKASAINKADSADDATPSVPGDLGFEVLEIDEDGKQHAESEPDQEEESQSSSEVAHDALVLPSGVFGGIATALGMRPATAREARLEKENQKLKDQNKFLRFEYNSIETAARKYHHDAYKFHHENQRLQETLEAMTLEVKGITKRYDEAKSLSETRGKELLGAQVFLTKADALSMSELIHKVDGLNDELYQAAASLGEAIVPKKIESSASASEEPRYSTEQASIAKSLLGSPLCKILNSQARKTDEGINPLLVQIALQAFLVVFCTQRIRSWTSNVQLNSALQDVYEKIWASSDQAVSGRWRALTRAQLKPDSKEWVKDLMTDLDAILAVASWEISSAEDKQTLEARLPAIFKVLLDVREAIGEKFTSADVEIGTVGPTVAFNDSYMDEHYEADEGGAEGVPKIVIATVGMGLRKIVIYQGSRAYNYVLSPKVVLESSLKAVLEPPPPRATRSKTSRK